MQQPTVHVSIHSKDRRKVVESLADQVDSLDRPGITFREGEKSRTWITYRRILQKCDETLQSVDVHLNNPPMNSKLLVLSQAALHRFYMGLREFLIESDQILAKEKPIPKHLYTNLCSKFMEVFLLNVRSGLLESSGMTIKGVKSSSDPDLRATVPVSSFGRISSVLVINVEEGRSTHSAHYYTKKTIRAINTCQDVFFTLSFQNYQNRGEFSMILCIFCGKPSFISLQMKPDYKHRVPAGPFQITEAVQHRVLEQHASQLLLDFKMSVFADIGAIFGIICMRTSCMDIDTWLPLT
uniref:Uncharacterized protein n=1 Tax=Magallana gigas TaxID=29159 RepID=K1RUW6_MAGGI